MKFLLRLLLVFSYFLSIDGLAQKKQDRNCESNCFSAAITSSEKVSESCTNYEMTITHDGSCSYALSHFAIEIPCGQVTNLWNSQNWKQVVGLDPTSGLSGIKIDDINEFGKSGLKSFRVKFTLCTTSCEDPMNCWKPLVAYKASTCVHYDTLHASCQQLKASLIKENASCFGAANGKLFVVVESGAEPFSYLWSNGGTTSSITGLVSGQYSVVVKDARGAETTLQDSITQPSEIIVQGNVEDASCSGTSDGTISITASGGVSPYSYLWSNGSTTPSLSQLSAGNYSVTVTDASGCQVAKTFTVTNNSDLSITFVRTLPDCNGANGSLDVTVSGGEEPYQYQWSNGSTEEDIDSLAAGVYELIVFDANGCFKQSFFNVTENNTLKLSVNVTPTSCLDDASGAIDLTVTGGTAPYQYQWSNGETTQDPSGLTSGNYTVTVTDAKGCTKTLRVSVPKRTFTIPNVVKQPLCSGDTNGAVELQEPIGGVPPYSYVWSTGDTTKSISGLAPGTYSVIVTDSTGCSRQLYFVIIDPQPLVAAAVVTNDQCNAEGFFDIDLSVSGGTAPYRYQWSNGATTQDLENVTSGTYQVEVTDVNGCTIMKEVVITMPTSPLVCLVAAPTTIPTCNSQGNLLHTSVSDADSYSWTIQSNDPLWAITSGVNGDTIIYTAGNNSSAVFHLSITKEGCTQTCSYTINACVDDNSGGSGGGEDPGNGTCDDCFGSTINVVRSDASCTTYEAVVITDGNCRHDLSHWTIAIPCGEISNIWNSEGWATEVGTDPTTGIQGLKVDNIQDFGSSSNSFIVRFTVCNQACEWNPVVAYKAGQCIAYDTTQVKGTATLTLSLYPNPFVDVVTFEWVSAENSESHLEILDQFGQRTAIVFHGQTIKGTSQNHSWNAGELPSGIYYYKLISGSNIVSGKLLRK